MTKYMEPEAFKVECNRRRTCGLILFTGSRAPMRSEEARRLREDFGGIYDKYRGGYLFEDWQTFFQACATIYPESARAILRAVETPEPVAFTLPAETVMAYAVPDERPVLPEPLRMPEPEPTPPEEPESPLTGHTCLVCREQITEATASDLPSFCSGCANVMMPGVRT